MAGNIKRIRRLDPCKLAFFMVDIQEAFRTVMPLFNGLLQNAQKLLTAGKIFEVPLFVSEQYPEKLGETVAELDICHAYFVLEKTRFGIMQPSLLCKLQEVYGDKPQDVVLLGLEAHVCIEQAAMDLLEKDINVTIAADCCCSRLNQDRDLALKRLQHIGCIVSTSESIIFNLLQDKNHPKFNDIRKLVAKPSADMQLTSQKTP